jgi:hypothetical protein
MLVLGPTLLHSWCCPKDEIHGFSWQRRAAEVAVGNLERARAGLGAVRGERRAGPRHIRCWPMLL